jgi:hypothetical protein
MMKVKSIVQYWSLYGKLVISLFEPDTYVPIYWHRLTQKHDGKYLAEVVAECLKRFGLEFLACTLLVCFDTKLTISISRHSSMQYVWIMPATVILWQNIYHF